MDLQLQLASKGNALSYASPEISGLPKWAVWQNQAYGTTFEPVSFAYNKRLLAADAVPQSHADLVRLMKEKHDVFKEKIATFDPEKSGVGFLMMTQDAKVFPQFWDLAKVSAPPAQKFIQAQAQCWRRSVQASILWPIILSAPMCCCARKRSVSRLGVAEGLHARVFARRFYFQDSAQSQRRQTISRLHSFQTRPDRDVREIPGLIRFAATCLDRSPPPASPRISARH